MYASVVSNALTESWQYTTICIESDIGDIVGTGVLIAETPTTQSDHSLHVTWENPIGHIYLATARHVLSENESVISTTLLYFLRYSSNGTSGLRVRR